VAKSIGVILSGSTSRKATSQLYVEYEGKVHEGEICFVQPSVRQSKILCRIDKIIPFSEFYEEGDAWSEARRRRAQIPSEISRKYYILQLELLGEIKGSHLVEVTSPPVPGDEVLTLDDENELLAVMKPKEKDKATIEFGTFIGYRNVHLILDLDAIPMHLAVLGVTGSGKSYTVGYLLEQLSNIDLGNIQTALTTIIIDANGDYLDFYNTFHIKNQRIGKYSDVYRFVFNKSPARLSKGVKTITINIDEFEPREVAELIMTYYSGGDINELQVAGLEQVFRKLQEESGYSVSSLLIDKRNYNNKLLAELSKAKEDKLIHEQTLSAILRALNKFRNDIISIYELIQYSGLVTLSSEFIDKITDPKNPTLVILDFSADGAPGISLQIKQLVISYITKLLLKKFTEYKIIGKEKILLLIIEEAQNYCPNLANYPIGYSLARNNLAQIATQGRKFGLSLCLISQRPSFVDPIILSMVNTFIIHRVSAGDVPFIKTVTGGLPEIIEDKLVNLTTGRAIVTGQMNRLGFPIIVEIPERRIKPTVGGISVSKILTG
jgi:DNA helicase HerA-like ATPase